MARDFRHLTSKVFAQRSEQCARASTSASLNAPRKRDLQAMLAEAVRNTAAMSNPESESADGR